MASRKKVYVLILFMKDKTPRLWGVYATKESAEQAAAGPLKEHEYIWANIIVRDLEP